MKRWHVNALLSVGFFILALGWISTALDTHSILAAFTPPIFAGLSGLCAGRARRFYLRGE